MSNRTPAQDFALGLAIGFTVTSVALYVKAVVETKLEYRRYLKIRSN